MIRIYACCNTCKYIVFPPEDDEDAISTCVVYPNGIPSEERDIEKTGEPGECNGVCQFEKKDFSYILEEVMKKFGHLD